jgi:hypothetical protein
MPGSAHLVHTQMKIPMYLRSVAKAAHVKLSIETVQSYDTHTMRRNYEDEDLDQIADYRQLRHAT